MSYAQQMMMILPEIVLAVGALVLMLVSAWGGHSSARGVSWTAVAVLIGAEPDEVYFTSGATESNNLAIKGIARMYRGRKDHIVSCVSEHMCVLDSLFNLENEGSTVTYLEVGVDGLIDLDALADAITGDTILVSIMTVQNEIGVVQPLDGLGDPRTAPDPASGGQEVADCHDPGRHHGDRLLILLQQQWMDFQLHL